MRVYQLAPDEYQLLGRLNELLGSASAPPYVDQLLLQRERLRRMAPRLIRMRLSEPKSLSAEYAASLDAAIAKLVFDVAPPPNDVVARAELLKRLQAFSKLVEETSELRMFGSCVSNLHSAGADLDLTLVLPAGCVPPMEKQRTMITQLASVLEESGEFASVVARPKARVPIVALEDASTGLKSDICMNNSLALINSRLLRTYVRLDERVRPLVFVVKKWAKARSINNPYRGTPSSYAYVLLVIHYLQTVTPPVLPVLQQIAGGAWAESAEAMLAQTHDGRAFDCTYCADSEALRGAGAMLAQLGRDPTHSVWTELPETAAAWMGSTNTKSVGELLVHFFVRYARDFNFGQYVVSVRTGRYLSKQEKGWTTKEKGFRGDRHLFCIEDPFELTHDLGRVMDRQTVGEVREELERAANLLSRGGSLEELCIPWGSAPGDAKQAVKGQDK